MAKKPQRTPEQQEYRDNLAHNLKELRKNWDVWRSLAETLLESETWTTEYISSKIEKFDNKLAEDLIKEWNYDFLVENLSRFNWLSKNVAKALIDEYYGDVVLKNLDKFEWLDWDIADRIVGELCPRNKGVVENILDNLNKFKWLSMDFAENLILTIIHGPDNVDEYYGVEKVLNNLNSFEWSDCEKHLAERFDWLNYRDWNWENAWWVALANNLEKFEGLDYKKLAEEILNETDGWPLIAYNYAFGSIEWINYEELIHGIIHWENAWVVDEYIDSNLSEWANFDALAQELINAHEYEYVVRHLDKFTWVNHNDLAHKLIGNKEWKELLINHLYNFEWLDKEIAEALIENWSKAILQHLESFNWIDKKILEKIIKNTETLRSFLETVESTLNNVDKFIWLSQQDVIELWIKSWRRINIVKCLKKLQWSGYDLNYQKIVEKVVELWDGEFLIEVPDLWQWLELDYQRIAESFINSRNRELFMNNIDKFEWLDLQKIAEKLIKLWHWDYVAKHPEKFWLKKEK